MVFTFPLTKRGDFAVFFVRGSKNSFYHSTNFTTNISTNIPNVDFPYTGGGAAGPNYRKEKPVSAAAKTAHALGAERVYGGRERVLFIGTHLVTSTPQ